MRALAPLLLLASACAALLWYSLSGDVRGSTPAAPLGPRVAALGPTAVAPAARVAAAPSGDGPAQAGASAALESPPHGSALSDLASEPSGARGGAELAPVPDAAVADAPPTAGGAARLAVDGVVRDRLGAPVEGERVWLLPAGIPFPAAEARLVDYVTARTGKDGEFSLAAPDPGPWQVAVGAPGEARCEPSEPRRLDGPARAEAVVPGTGAVRVTFEGLPTDAASVMVELLALREPAQGQGGGRGARGGGADAPDSAGGAPRGRRGQGTNGAGGDGNGGGNAGGGNRRGGGAQGGGQRGAALVDARPRALLASLQDPAQTPRRGGGGRGARGNGQGSGGQGQDAGQAPVGPPPEVWRALERRTLSAEERAASAVEFTGLRPGATARLGLRIGEDYLEGQARFVLVADTRVEVRVFPITTTKGTSLGYVVVPQPAALDEAPVGVRWRD